MQLYLADGTPVNTPAPSLYPAPAPQPSERRYVHGYEEPTDNFCRTYRPDGDLLAQVLGTAGFQIWRCLRAHLNHKTGQCNPSISTIAWKTNLAPSTVKQNLLYLYEGNVVQRVNCHRHHPRHNADGHTIERVSNQYLFPRSSDWTLDKVSRKRARMPGAQKQPTTVETYPTGETKIVQPVGRNSATNKTGLNKTKKTKQTEQRARERNSRRAESGKPAEHTPEAVEVVPAAAVPFEVPSEALQVSVPPEVASTEGKEPVAASETEPLLSQLMAVGVEERKAHELVVTKPVEVIRQQIEWLPHRKAINPAAMLIRSIERNYGEPPELSQHRKVREKAQEAVRQEAEQTQAVASQIQQRHQQAQEREQALAQEDAENARLNAAWEALDESVRVPLERAVAQRMGVLSRLSNRPQGAIQPIQRVVLREYLAGTLKGAGGNITSSESRLLE